MCQLRECPFCGGIVIQKVGPVNGNRFFYCPECSANVVFELHLNDIHTIECWNRRTDGST